MCIRDRAFSKQDGLTVFMQPVQDLTIEDRVSRTQYQMTLSNPDPVSYTHLRAHETQWRIAYSGL